MINSNYTELNPQNLAKFIQIDPIVIEHQILANSDSGKALVELDKSIILALAKKNLTKEEIYKLLNDIDQFQNILNLANKSIWTNCPPPAKDLQNLQFRIETLATRFIQKKSTFVKQIVQENETGAWDPLKLTMLKDQSLNRKIAEKPKNALPEYPKTSKPILKTEAPPNWDPLDVQNKINQETSKRELRDWDPLGVRNMKGVKPLGSRAAIKKESKPKIVKDALINESLYKRGFNYISSRLFPKSKTPDVKSPVKQPVLNEKPLFGEDSKDISPMDQFNITLSNSLIKSKNFKEARNQANKISDKNQRNDVLDRANGPEKAEELLEGTELFVLPETEDYLNGVNLFE